MDSIAGLEALSMAYIILNDSYLCFIRFVPLPCATHHPPILNTLADAIHGTFTFKTAFSPRAAGGAGDERLRQDSRHGSVHAAGQSQCGQGIGAARQRMG
ncbi:hypothetical protein EMIT043CA1_30366 [Pseudomonas brassicacearum]